MISQGVSGPMSAVQESQRKGGEASTNRHADVHWLDIRNALQFGWYTTNQLADEFGIKRYYAALCIREIARHQIVFARKLRDQYYKPRAYRILPQAVEVRTT